MTVNRVVAIASAVISLALAILPVAANMDWKSTAGVIAGIVAVLGITQKWLEGWQKHEANVAIGASLRPPDQGDVGPVAVEEK